jgi:Ca2+-binding RTX toxin-like protein
MAVKKGTRGNDLLTGTASRDYIYAHLGNDTLNGLAGNDFLYAGSGNDTLNGGRGNDDLQGGAGRDRLIGGDGNDLIDAGGGILSALSDDGAKDFVDAGAGADFVSMGLNDTAIGGSGIDSLFLSATTDNLDFSRVHLASASAVGTGAHAATKAGGFESVSVSIAGDRPNTIVIMSRGNDSAAVSTSFSSISGPGVNIKGGAGDDTLSGGSRNDTLQGGIGDDRLTGSPGNDVLIGGSGADQFNFNLFGFAPVGSNINRIRDFSVVDDEILISVQRTQYNFGNEANLLLKGANPTNATTAAGVAQLLYNTTTGLLSIDANGATAGGVTHFAQLTTKPNLTAKDIWIDYLTDFAV